MCSSNRDTSPRPRASRCASRCRAGRAAAYDLAAPREQPAIVAANPTKLAAMQALVERHAGERILVMGTYVEPLRAAARALGAPLIWGGTPHREREKIFEQFRSGATRTLVLSRVGNFAIDLPEASVLIQISGTMGSRQEEAQRLGRMLRPKPRRRELLHDRHAAHPRGGPRAAPPAVPDRAGLSVLHRGHDPPAAGSGGYAELAAAAARALDPHSADPDALLN